MWWPTHARAPLATQNVLFSCAPHATTRRRRRRPAARGPRGRARASGAAPSCGRARRARPSRRCGRAIGRSCTRNASAIGASRSARVVVAIGDRLVASVAARHHQRAAGVREQQVVQRRVGQHHAELGDAGRDGRRDARAGPARARARSARATERSSASSAASSTTSAVRRGDVGHHQRERLVLAVLARAQRRDRGLVVGAAGEVVAAEALDRHDRAVAQQRRRGGDRVRGPPAGAPVRRRARPARRARVRLGVEAPVARVVVLGPAGRAHREARHRRQRAVVGDALHDREARPAVGAVRERVAVAPVGRVAQLAQACRARRASRARRARTARRPRRSRRSRSRSRRRRPPAR